MVSPPDHYRALGLTRTATTDDVRKAFQALAKELHPDANPNASPGAGAAARFQAAKEAYDVLRSDAQRQSYDAVLSARLGAPADPYEAARLRRRAEAFDRSYKGGPSGQTRMMRLMEQLVRPRVLAAVPLLAMASWWLTSRLSPDVDYATPGDVVPAWWNPTTNRWETPAPWDPLFHAHAHTMKAVARRHVTQSAPGNASTLPGPLR